MGKKLVTTKIYEYSNCSTCKDALRFLDAEGIEYQRVAIVETPPTVAELKTMLGFVTAAGGSIKNLFNTSGVLYREMGVADKLARGLSESDALQLLSENGKLVRRPFIITAHGGAVGFKKENWKTLFST